MSVMLLLSLLLISYLGVGVCATCSSNHICSLLLLLVSMLEWHKVKLIQQTPDTCITIADKSMLLPISQYE